MGYIALSISSYSPRSSRGDTMPKRAKTCGWKDRILCDYGGIKKGGVCVYCGKKQTPKSKRIGFSAGGVK
jgi:hypothetical protein